MARRRPKASEGSLSGPEDDRAWLAWLARHLAFLLLRDRPARADVEDHLRLTLHFWARYAGVEVPADPPREAFQAAFVKHLLRQHEHTNVPDRAALAAVRELFSDMR